MLFSYTGLYSNKLPEEYIKGHYKAFYLIPNYFIHILCLPETNHSFPPPPKNQVESGMCCLGCCVRVCAVGETDGGMRAECSIMKPARLLNG